jgi:hypothetical protein
MLQDQAAQMAAAMKEFQDAQFVNNIPLLAVGGLTLVLISGGALLLARTATGFLNARFLRHLAIAFAINAANSLVTIIYVLLKAALAYFALETAKSVNPLPESFPQGLLTMNSTFHGISLMISLLSNLFLFAAWDLLRRYPEQGVRKSLFTFLTTFFGSGSLLIVLFNLLVIIEKTKSQFWWVLDFIDLGSSTAAILLLGWQVQKTLGPRIKERVSRATLPWITFMAYLIWGGSQPFHEVIRWFPWYAAILLLSGFAAAIMTILLSSKSLDERPEYSSSQVSSQQLIQPDLP